MPSANGSSALTYFVYSEKLNVYLIVFRSSYVLRKSATVYLIYSAVTTTPTPEAFSNSTIGTYSKCVWVFKNSNAPSN